MFLCGFICLHKQVSIFACLHAPDCMLHTCASSTLLLSLFTFFLFPFPSPLSLSFLPCLDVLLTSLHPRLTPSQVKQLSNDLESERSLRAKKEELVKEKEAEVRKICLDTRNTHTHTHTNTRAWMNTQMPHVHCVRLATFSRTWWGVAWLIGPNHFVGS